MYRHEDIDFYDRKRDRPIPVRLWQPTDSVRGWLLFSVGFGGERDGYAFLAKAWAERGLATAVVEHVGSNLEVLKSLPGPSRAERNRQVVAKVEDPEELAARPRDLGFVVGRLQQRFSGLPLGLGGHSYGSYSVLAALGLPTVPRLPSFEPAIDGVKACLVISPQAPGILFSPRALGQVRVASLVMTGSKDVRLDGSGSYLERAAVYDHLPATLRQLVVLEGVEHMDFAGLGLALGEKLRTIAAITGEWWESTFWGEQTPAERAARLARAGGSLVPGEYR